MDGMSAVKYAELGAFLRSRRERIRPADVGLPAGPRRRVPGLRREEVAQLAGASVDYYNELERGAGSQPSEQMIAALARALRLSADERDYLYRLADRPVPVQGGAASHVHPGMLDLLGRMPSTPAQVITDLHVTLVQNPLAVALVGDQTGFRGPRASFVHRWFTEPDTRLLYPEADHEGQSRAFVADLRAAAARRDAKDPEAGSMIRTLLAVSPEFAALWADHDVAFRRDDRKRIVHPTIGLIEVNCLNLFSEDGRQRLLWFTPAVGTESAGLLELLGVVGTQEVVSSPRRTGGSSPTRSG
ncbi:MULTISPECIES: helix-turn-helix transcriptional regulator [Streptomyces]|uniref:Helix-turn-helix transcriptional regulator n=2 Tax=Streptomyces rochei group TaxID=2867164 RepID=A0AAX3ZP18_STRRO|nr:MULTISPECIES: helix-turn-helix transcriptional regulator [Streptomyces]GGY70749.1 DNA-binding protein [Streptomyces geysiriensis]MBQ0915482.1 helix-turn-helix domain-containing protein [Streptomyces sp. RM99]MCC8449810.1 helix-turn-helix transcriptional regulator [Streptomyces rochei]MDI3097369.1 helix-turn-helix transcriptional regulator [Streptomyces sp. AN-3]WMC88007.1 helix-turn-helix transcriptional regulator [Streptomyces rochei]